MDRENPPWRSRTQQFSTRVANFSDHVRAHRPFTIRIFCGINQNNARNESVAALTPSFVKMVARSVPTVIFRTENRLLVVAVNTPMASAAMPGAPVCTVPSDRLPMLEAAIAESEKELLPGVIFNRTDLMVSTATKSARAFGRFWPIVRFPIPA